MRRDVVALAQAHAGAPAAISRSRKRWALAVAGAADIAQLAFLPFFVEGATSPFDVALDVATAVALLFVVGFQWRLVIALAAELVPGVDMFPTWTALVATLPVAPAPAPVADQNE